MHTLYILYIHLEHTSHNVKFYGLKISNQTPHHQQEAHLIINNNNNNNLPLNLISPYIYIHPYIDQVDR